MPAPELEALRDLVRAREDLRGDLMSARHRIGKLLLRRGLVWGGPGETWSTRHLQWLSAVRFGQPLVESSSASTSPTTKSCSLAATAPLLVRSKVELRAVASAATRRRRHSLARRGQPAS